jgi:hypothetical protein
MRWRFRKDFQVKLLFIGCGPNLNCGLHRSHKTHPIRYVVDMNARGRTFGTPNSGADCVAMPSMTIDERGCVANAIPSYDGNYAPDAQCQESGANRRVAERRLGSASI